MSSRPPLFGLSRLLRTVASGFLGAIHDRIERLSLEIEEEKRRLLGVLLRATLVFVFGMTAVLFASAAAAYLFWARSPILVLAALSLAHFLAAVVSGFFLAAYARRQPRPLDSTLNELAKARTSVARDK